MPIPLSSAALLQITNRDISKYERCMLYNMDDIYICDLHVLNISYSFSRDYGVSILNLVIANTDGRHNNIVGNLGAYPIYSDYKIVYIEGYDTINDSDKYPKFKGYIKNITFQNNKGIQTINFDVYDELLLTQQADLDKLYIAPLTTVVSEELQPYITGVPIVDIDTLGDSSKITLVYSTEFNSILDNMFADINSNETIYINNSIYNKRYTLIAPNGRNTTDGCGYIIFSGSMVGTIAVDDILLSSDGNFSAKVTYVNAPSKIIKVDSSDRVSYGTYNHGDTLYVDGGGSITAKNIYQIMIKKVSGDTAVLTDKVHTGKTNTYLSTYKNWNELDDVTIDVNRTGIVSNETYDDSYDINYKKGVIRFNNPLDINNISVTASFKYFSKGMYAEDILTDIFTIEDSTKSDSIINGNFSVGDYNWNIVTSSGYTNRTHYLSYNNNFKVITNVSASTNMIMLYQDIDILSGYTYTLTANITTSTNSGITGIGFYNTSGILLSNTTYNVSNYQLISHTYTAINDTTVRASVYISGSVKNQIWIVNCMKCLKSPNKITSLSTDNLYCTVGIEDGSGLSNYSLLPNDDFMIIPVNNFLTYEINNSDTYISVNDASVFTLSGYIFVDSEIIHYNNAETSGNTLTIIERGYNNTNKVSHDTGTTIYQICQPNTIWYMKYSNIIPKTENSSSSYNLSTNEYVYDSINGVNVGSASSFTIVGNTFSRFFYREGIVITNGSATSVTLTSNKDYYFNQLQSTGINIPYLLIDYKNVSTRFDAINMIRKLIAPNYIINTTIRKNGSNYLTYIKGRYLSQKITADYDLDIASDIAYTNDKNNYNRVKMFGKKANPVNLMYNPETKVYEFNGNKSIHINNIELNYNKPEGNYYLFIPNISNGSIIHTKSTPNNIIKFNITPRLMRCINSRITFETLYNDEKYYTNYNNARWSLALINAKNTSISSPILTGLRLTKSSDPVAFGNATTIRTYDLYNVYYIKYNNTNTFTDNIEVTNTNISTILNYFVIPFNETLLYDYYSNYIDAIMFVKHTIGSPVFTPTTVINNGTASATIFALPYIDKINTQVNYNSVNFDTPELKLYNIGIDYIKNLNTILSNDIQLKINGIPRDNKSIITQINGIPSGVYEWETTHDKRTAWQWKKYYLVKDFKCDNLYINRDYDDYYNNKLIYGTSSENDLTVGTIQFLSGTSIIRTIKYKNQSTIDSFIVDSLLADNKLEGRNGSSRDNSSENFNDINDIHRYIIGHCTKIKYFKKINTDITPPTYDIDTGYVKILKSELDERKISPSTNIFTIDADISTQFISDFMTTETMPLINRLRNYGKYGVDQQVALNSKYPINEIDLFSIDLGSIKEIGSIGIQIGYFYRYPKEESQSRYDVNFSVTLYYTDEETDINEITTWTTNEQIKELSVTTGDNKILTSTELGEKFKARFLKIAVSSDKPSITNEIEDKDSSWYCCAIAGLSIYENDILYTEQTTDSDIINLYKDQTVYEELYTQELLDNYANSQLTEFQKNNNLVTTVSPWSPHIELGQTIRINDTTNGNDQNYFVESISKSNGHNFELAYYGD